MRSIFINYRRDDSQGEAGRLFDDLTLRFSRESVFMDVTAIEPGRDFRKAIDQSVAACSVLLALIGQDWLESKHSPRNRRLDDPNDFVRMELASALRRDIPVIPVLVRGAKVPQAEQLPDDLQELAYRNAVELTHARWKSDVQVLIQALQAYVEMPPAHISGISPAAQTPVPGTASVIDLQTIDRVSRELAAYIGPISEVVVKRAARRCCSMEELCGMVALEIEAEGDRAKFLKASRS